MPSKPIISINPISRIRNEGDPVSFKVELDTSGAASGPYTFSWRKDGRTIYQANTDTYTITSVKKSDEGDYACFVTNAQGSSLTQVGTLTVVKRIKLTVPDQPEEPKQEVAIPKEVKEYVSHVRQWTRRAVADMRQIVEAVNPDPPIPRDKQESGAEGTPPGEETIDTYARALASKTLVIEHPTGLENVSFFRLNILANIVKVVAVVKGSSSPSVSWILRHDLDRSTLGSDIIIAGRTTTNTTTGEVITAIDDGLLPENTFIWLTTSAVSGNVTEFMITVFFAP